MILVRPLRVGASHFGVFGRHQVAKRNINRGHRLELLETEDAGEGGGHGFSFVAWVTLKYTLPVRLSQGDYRNFREKKESSFPCANQKRQREKRHQLDWKRR